MDIEKAARARLIAYLGDSFVCFEEVELSHAVFRSTVRADVVAIPIAPDFSDITLAFEVKVPTPEWQFKDWSAAAKQASDYVWSETDALRVDNFSSPRRISAAFVFPGPHLGMGFGSIGPQYYRTHDRETIRGAFDLAIHFRVGYALEHLGLKNWIEMRFGSNTVWSSRKGFAKQTRNLLGARHRLGSRKIELNHLRKIS